MQKSLAEEIESRHLPAKSAGEVSLRRVMLNMERELLALDEIRLRGQTPAHNDFNPLGEVMTELDRQTEAYKALSGTIVPVPHPL